MRIRTQQGLGIIEVVIGSAIIVTGILSLIGAYTTYVKYALSNDKTVQAVYLAEEAVEAVSFMRDSGWTKYIKPLSTTTPYYLTWNGTMWATTTVPQYVDGIFLRTFSVADVKRDGNDRIAASGTYDPGTKLVTVTVQYRQNTGTTTRTLSAYITDIYNN